MVLGLLVLLRFSGFGALGGAVCGFFGLGLW